jgi:hypothetical protein
MPNDRSADGLVPHAVFRAAEMPYASSRPNASSREGILAMPRPLWILAALAATATFSAGGCRSCSNCHDYDPPVAACDCHACGTERAGSGTGGYIGQGHVTDADAIHVHPTEQETVSEPERAEEVAP